MDARDNETWWTAHQNSLPSLPGVYRTLYGGNGGVDGIGGGGQYSSVLKPCTHYNNTTTTITTFTSGHLWPFCLLTLNLGRTGLVRLNMFWDPQPSSSYDTVIPRWWHHTSVALKRSWAHRPGSRISSKVLCAVPIWKVNVEFTFVREKNYNGREILTAVLKNASWVWTKSNEWIVNPKKQSMMGSGFGQQRT